MSDIKIGVVESIISQREILVSELQKKENKYLCTIPSSQSECFEDEYEPYFENKKIEKNSQVLFVLPEEISDNKGYVINFYSPYQKLNINESITESAQEVSVRGGIIERKFKDGSFSINTKDKMIKFFMDVKKKSIDVFSKFLDIKSKRISIKDNEDFLSINIGDSGNFIHISKKERGKILIKIGSEFLNYDTNIYLDKKSINIDSNKDININDEFFYNKKMIKVKKFDTEIVLDNKKTSVINNSSNFYIGAKGAELSVKGNGLFIDKNGKIKLQSENSVYLLSNKTGILSDDSIDIKSKKQIRIESNKVGISDSSSKISPVFIKKAIAKITNKIIALKPIAPTSGGPCAPDPTSISLSTIPNEMIPEKIIINETKEKNK